MFEKYYKYRFLFEELVKRDFKKKYKRAFFGMLWSVLSPLAMLLVMMIVFTHIFGSRTPHYTIYLFCGQIVYSYFTEATNSGMTSLVSNADIFSKTNVPKYMFLVSKNISSFINFVLTLVVFFLFVAGSKIPFSPLFFLLVYPIICLVVFNMGMGLILSALYIMFRDMQYLYAILTQILMYFSAIFFTLDMFPESVQRFFLLNPLYVYIRYFRMVVIEQVVPSLNMHLLSAFYALIVVVIGAFIYKKYNYKFLYYV